VKAAVRGVQLDNKPECRRSHFDRAALLPADMSVEYVLGHRGRG
jgi:hypothetical protein